MNARTKLLRDLVRDALYVVDEAAIAQAIIVRATARDVVADASFRNQPGGESVRSFRHDRRARSFRLAGAGQRTHIAR